MSETLTPTGLDVAAIKQEIADGYINVQPHPGCDLRILNYSQKAQFDWRWNDATMQCRGLIVDPNWNVVARPFQKFFSVEQLGGKVPLEPFEAYEKMDGSLGILYFIDGVPFIASRGSFTSDQARRATRMLRERYSDAKLDESFTYLFEIIYPENRIVVDYGDREELVLLAIIETETGNEWPLDAYDSVFPVVKRYDGIESFDELMSWQDTDREGFVVRFESGQRVKIKFDEYKRLHKLLTGVSPKAIWEILRSGSDLSAVVDRVPDEFHQWVKETENDLRAAFATIEAAARANMLFGEDRRKLAEHFKQCQYPSVMFAMLDGKKYDEQIWRMVKPSGSAFRCDIDI